MNALRTAPSGLPRILAAASVLALLPLPALAQRDGCRDLPAESSDIRVAGPEEPGERLVVTGRVLDRDGTTPVAGVRVRVFHTDAAGWYSDGGMDESAARLCGVLATDEDGGYRIETILPGHYATGGPQPHLHFDLTLPDGRGSFVTVFPEVRDGDDPATGDRRARRRPVARSGDGPLRLVADLWAR